MPDVQTNVLYYGNNVDILRRFILDASVDLIHLDPPFQFQSRLRRAPLLSL